MALAQATKSHEPTYTINDAMDVLLSRLDEAIDDMESDRVQIVEEAWDGKKKIQSCNCPERQAGCEGKKKYILQQFKYREYAEDFSQKIKKRFLHLTHFLPDIIQ